MILAASSWPFCCAGYAGVTVAAEPTGHRWRVVGQLAGDRQMPLVCVQPLVTSWARRAEDLTFDKTDDKDAVLIARLAGQLRCYLPEPADETWARLRHLGVRRARLIAEHTAQVQQMRDLLECAWPAVLDAARQPFKSTTWHAALTVTLARAADGDLSRVTRLGRCRFDAAVRRLGRTEIQPRLRGPVPPSDQPRAQQAIHRASPRSPRSRAAAATACCRHHRPAMGSRHRRWRQERPATHRCLIRTRPIVKTSEPGRVPRGIETQTRDLACHPGQPRPSQRNPITRCRAPPHDSYAGTATRKAPAKPLTTNALR